jgi:hypothetical protein
MTRWPTDLGSVRSVWQGLWPKGVARVSTIYKRKAEKVRPVDDPITDRSRPGGIDNWKEVLFDKAKRNIQPGRFDCWLTLRFSDTPRGSRLILERIEKLIIGLDLTL